MRTVNSPPALADLEMKHGQEADRRTVSSPAPAGRHSRSDKRKRLAPSPLEPRLQHQLRPRAFHLGRLDIRLGLSRLLSTVLGWLEALRISSRLLAAAVPWLGLSILQVPLGVSFFALFSLSRHLRSSRGLSGLGRKPMQDRSRSPPAPLASRPPLLVAGITRRSRAAPLSGAIREPDITRMFDGASILQA
jgi:hypothetical protein